MTFLLVDRNWSKRQIYFMFINTKSVLHDTMTRSPSYRPTIVILVIIKYQFTDKRTHELRKGKSNGDSGRTTVGLMSQVTLVIVLISATMCQRYDHKGCEAAKCYPSVFSKTSLMEIDNCP